VSKETCQRCGEKDYDRRTLYMACFYEMDELKIPFDHTIIFGHVKLPINKHNEGPPYEDIEKMFYTLLVCKDCRADWMGAIKNWFNEKPVRNSCGSGIFVRHNGATVEITEDEWYRDNPGREPVRVVKP
jgi:hypothetical protein